MVVAVVDYDVVVVDVVFVVVDVLNVDLENTLTSRIGPLIVQLDPSLPLKPKT